MLSFFRQFALRTDSSSSSTLRSRFRLNGRVVVLLLGAKLLRLVEVDEELQLSCRMRAASATESSGDTAPFVSTDRISLS